MEKTLGYTEFYAERPKSNRFNVRQVAFVLGVLVLVEAGLFALCAGISLLYRESEYTCFLQAMAVNAVIGGGLMVAGKRQKTSMNRRDGYTLVALAWVCFTILGMLPFCFSGQIASVTDAFFETMSGFTTTGATVFNHVETLPHGLLFWRSLTQWIGGLGIVLFTVTVLPWLGNNNRQLFLAEPTGVAQGKTHIRPATMAKYLWIVYIGLTMTETLLLALGGMNLFDSVCHSLTTTSTGGFSTKQESIAYWNSPYIEYVISGFMILSGINFSLYFIAAKGHLRNVLKDEELRWFLISIGILTIIITAALFITRYESLEVAFRKALFQVATSHTTCGFATDDYNLWPPFTWMLLIFAMICGGCTGSSGGGIKSLRLLVIARSIRNQFKQMLHPRAVLPVRINGETISAQTTVQVYTFFVSYLLCIFIGWALLMCFGVGMTEAMSTVVSAIGNVGPGLGTYGPSYSWGALPDGAKWVLSILMFIGRMEIFGILLLFYRRFWKED